jgi:signal transduction histidine kinase
MTATVRGLVVFGAVWQALWFAGDPALRGTVTAGVRDLASLLIAASIIAWLATWVALFGPRRSLVVAQRIQISAMAALAASGLILTANSVTGADGWLVGASIVNLASGLAGLILARRVAVIVIATMVTVDAVLVSVVVVAGEADQAWSLAMVYPLYALTLGLACTAARNGLVRSAMERDDSAAELRNQHRARATSEFADASIATAETRLHETVLNTLTAIERGGFGSDADTQNRLRERAEESAEVLTLLSEGSMAGPSWTGDLRVDLAGAIVDLEATDVQVHLVGDLSRDVAAGEIDDATYGALASAVRESLINVHRHAHATAVTVEGRVVHESRQDRWSVRVDDDGCGIGEYPAGFGVSSIIGEGMESVGGRSTVGSRPRGGTRVTLDVPVTASGSARLVKSMSPLRAVGVPMVFAFTLFTAYSALVTWNFAQRPDVNLLALALFLSTAAVLFLTSRDRRYTWMPSWACVATLVLVPAMMLVEVQAQAVPNPVGDWTSEVSAVFLFVVVATGPRWTGPLAIIAWLIGQEGQLVELAKPGTFVIVIAMVMGWGLRRTYRQTQADRQEAGMERAALVVSRGRLANAQQRYADVDTDALSEMLRGIARGDIDPEDDDVRRTCARYERMLRSVMRLRPESSMIERDLLRLVAVAHDRDIELNVVVADTVSARDGLDTFDDVQRLLDVAVPGSSARATISHDSQEFVFRFVGHVDPTKAARVCDHCEVMDEEQGLVSIEERWHEPAGRPSERSAVSVDEQLSAQGSGV